LADFRFVRFVALEFPAVGLRIADIPARKLFWAAGPVSKTALCLGRPPKDLDFFTRKKD